MSVLPLASFVVVTTAVLAFALLGLLAYDELKFQRTQHAANDAVIGPAVRSQPRPVAIEAPSLPRAA